MKHGVKLAACVAVLFGLLLGCETGSRCFSTNLETTCSMLSAKAAMSDCGFLLRESQGFNNILSLATLRCICWLDQLR